ncbi:CD3d molecule [Phyllostomus discolor]|uniref:T-cell surface glycoprotein CD3 delta chain n=1 Tax=Phyllostomus discolor TaxID=89673 RepID=A0A6J2LXS5_9CHIR|nr:T-cell surface glycoprotein CD3 delta chain isoform X2 [Phyllostomus discolor]KAF6102590.1 CD3d molecule [Phyllostomus discolor]
MEHRSFLAGLILAALLSQVSPEYQVMKELEDKVILSCDRGITWLSGMKGKSFSDNTVLDLGKRTLDPRGLYECNVTTGNSFKTFTVQVYYRMCQNCVELDSATLAGVIVTDVIATLLLALGVYCFAGHETGRLSRTADTQALLRNDQLYQPLRDRNDAQYSRLGENWPRNK